MLSQKRIASETGTVLAIILPECRRQGIENLLDKFAINEWRESDRVFLIYIPDEHVNNTRHIVSTVRRTSRDHGLDNSIGNVRYISLTDLNYKARLEIKWVKSYDFVGVHSYKFLADDFLEIRLKEWQLHWRQGVIDEMSKWHHNIIREDQIEHWLKQFDRLSGGRLRWVGERLLRNFKIWSPERLLGALSVKDDGKTLNAKTCVMGYEKGKSADSISVTFRKCAPHILQNDKVYDFQKFLNESAAEECYVFEDGVFTGIEISDYFKSLVGLPEYKKCEPLVNFSRLSNAKTYFRAAIGTDIGMHRLHATINELAIDVDISCGEKYTVLTESGTVKLVAGNLYEKDADGKMVLSNSDEDIVPQAFLDERWGERRAEAIQFCKNIGMQLVRSYQEGKGKYLTDRRISDFALGAGNMGFLFAFSHSVPKSTLPFFWCHGTSNDESGKIHKWHPLFPNAHRL